MPNRLDGGSDGFERAPLEVASDHVITGTLERGIRVTTGTLRIAGTLRGHVYVHRCAFTVVQGQLNGTLTVKGGAACSIHGALDGSATVSDGGQLTIEEGGVFRGTLRNEGLVIVRGVFIGTLIGRGEFRLEASGRSEAASLEED